MDDFTNCRHYRHRPSLHLRRLGGFVNVGCQVPFLCIAGSAQSESGWGEDGRCGMLTFSLTGEPVFGNVATFPTLCLLKSNPKKETYRCISHIVAVYIYTSLWLGTVSLPSCLVVVFCDLLLAEICTTAVLPKTCSPVRDNVNIPHLPSSPQKDSAA